EHLVRLGTNHTNRKHETHSVALSKQICPKPVARTAWRLQDVQTHWDDIQLRAWIKEGGKEVLYQEGSLGSLLAPQALIQDFFQQATMREGALMTCGTVAAIGGIRPSPAFRIDRKSVVKGTRAAASARGPLC